MVGCNYIAGPDAGDEHEKVQHRGAVNFLSIDHAAQVQEISDLAEVSRRSPQPVQHWIMSWRPSDWERKREEINKQIQVHEAAKTNYLAAGVKLLELAQVAYSTSWST